MPGVGTFASSSLNCSKLNGAPPRAIERNLRDATLYAHVSNALRPLKRSSRVTIWISASWLASSASARLPKKRSANRNTGWCTRCTSRVSASRSPSNALATSISVTFVMTIR